MDEEKFSPNMRRNLFYLYYYGEDPYEDPSGDAQKNTFRGDFIKESIFLFLQEILVSCQDILVEIASSKLLFP